MSLQNLNLKIDIQKMKLSEQEEFETLSGCSIFDLNNKGLSGRRLAALIYVFAKREYPDVSFADCLALDMEQAAEFMADDADPKEITE